MGYVCWKDIAKRKDAFADELSKRIYECRVRYSMTGDLSALEPMIRESVSMFAGGGLIVHEICHAKEIWLFGAGEYGQLIARLWPMQIAGILDNDPGKQGKSFREKYPVCAPSEIIHHPEATVVITSRPYHAAMKRQLLGLGVSEERIVDIGAWVEAEVYPSAYFDLMELPHDDQEVFLDVGSFDGKTAEYFRDWAGNRYKKIYCFEPDPENQEKIRARLFDKENVVIVPKGAWNCETQLHFFANGRESSYLDDQGESVISVDSIDHIVAEDRPTFIKLDVEGAELAALQGAKDTIRRHRPKIAVSIYHKPEDIFTLPDLLLTYHSDYRFYLRHYSLGAFDTVLYAI